MQSAAFAQTVTSIAPNNVTHRTTVLINGSGFTNTSTVRLYTGTDATTGSTLYVAPTTTTFVNANQLRVIFPAVIAAGNDAAIRGIRVYNGTVTPAGNAFTYTYTPPATTPTSAGITRIITNYNGYWSSSSTANSQTQPDTGHSLMAFQYNGTLYSTGGEAAVTNVLSSSTQTGTYTTGNWRALPINNIIGTVPTSSSDPNLIVLANKVDGDSNRAVPTSPAVAGLSVRDVLIDGIRGLNIGTGVTNLPSSSVLTFQATRIGFNAANLEDNTVITDNVPDIMVSQVADPSNGSFSVYCFVDASGNVVGKPVQVALNGVSALGTYKVDFFTLNAGSELSTATVNGSTTVGLGTRPIRMVAYKLSDFGITPDNKNQVVQFKVMPSGTSDPAFMAYNRDSFAIPAPEIANQPSSVAKCQGTNATFSVTVTATGTELTYQWEKNGVAITNPAANVTGATSATLNITNITAADYGIYRCVVTNPSGAAFSNSAYLNTVILSSTTSPTTTCLNTPATIEVNANGNTPLYKWYKNTTNSNVGGELIANATSSSYSPPVNTAGTLYYYAETYPTGYECAITKSTPIAFVVQTATNAGSITPNQTVCPNTSGTVTLSGYNGTIQWQQTTQTDGTTGWANIVGATGASYTNNAVTGITYYRAVVTNGTCSSATSSVSSLTANTTYIWTGNTSANWNTNSNWSCNLIPTSTVDVTIPANRPNQPVVNNDGTAHARTLTIDASASLNIATGGTLQVVNDIAVAPTASFVIDNNGALVQDNETTDNGFVTVKRNSNPLFRLDYTLWSSPVSGQQLLAFSPNTIANRFYEYKYANGSNGWIEGYWSVNPNTNFSAAKGYLIRMPNADSASGYNAGTGTLVHHGVFTGTPFNGTIEVPLSTVNNRFTAVGNPYASPINVEAFFNANTGKIDTGSGIYLWRKKNDANISSYVTVTLAAFTANNGTYNPTNTTPNSYAYGGGDQAGYFAGLSNTWTISQGQGFIVKTTAGLTNPKLVFNNSMRRAVPQTNGQSFFRQAQDTASRLWLNLTDSNNGFSQAAVAYIDGATTGLDYGYDGRSMIDENAISVYSIAADNKLNIQARPGFNATDIVQVGYNASKPGNYTLGLDRVDGVFTQGQDIYLKDNDLGVIRNLSDEAYSFTTAAGTFDSRFEVMYVNNSTADVTNPELSSNSIIVYKNGKDINITSGTAEMTGVTVYDINGRRLYSNSKINSTETVISGLEIQQQVIIVEVNTVKGTVSKKVVF
ncbi:T9SS sorting signal type C domain-containing protein [Flavobacterium psychrotrophum]|uniref:T9SS sorting signal type C domain-containing protein n=1 Tax=Flavobacterium psychrotrophum TaxID=2294119 RepID=UPI0013C417F6|nr:immunoglobulin domain-containing protein [Flavobacterium psychrotrophum]